MYPNTLGYSNGQPRDANNPLINSGGQCTDGLKMVVLIGEVANPTPGRCIVDFPLCGIS